MDPVNRKVSYKLYPNKAQTEALFGMLVLHQRLYNACLEHRKKAYDEWRKKIERYRDLTDEEKRQVNYDCSYYGQSRQLAEVRRELPEYRNLSVNSLRTTLNRIDWAFKAFFRRVKAGDKPGFPRFRSVERFPGFGLKQHGNGWKFTPGEGWRHGQLYVKGVSGTIRCRGKARTPGEVKTAELLHSDGVWHMSLTVECQPERTSGTAAAGLDWGVAKYATVVSHSKVEEIEAPRFVDAMQRKLRHEQRALARKKRGSQRRRKQRIRYARLIRRIVSKRRDFEHKLSKRLVDRYGLIATEKLAVKNLTRSAKGTIEAPGKNVRQKAGLNRRILDTSPANFLQKLKYKIEEAGGMWIEVPTQKVKPSQTCPACGYQEKKQLSDRTHRCKMCGYTEDRDRAAARVMLGWAEDQLRAA